MGQDETFSISPRARVSPPLALRVHQVPNIHTFKFNTYFTQFPFLFLKDYYFFLKLLILLEMANGTPPMRINLNVNATNIAIYCVRYYNLHSAEASVVIKQNNKATSFIIVQSFIRKTNLQ